MSSNEKQAEQAGESGTSLVQERLNWKLAQRDDRRVAQGLYAGEEIEEMHQLSDAGLLDEFFVYLEEIGMMSTFEQMVLPEVKRVLVLARFHGVMDLDTGLFWKQEPSLEAAHRICLPEQLRMVL